MNNVNKNKKQETIERIEKAIDGLEQMVKQFPKLDGYFLNAIHELEAAKHVTEITKEEFV